MKIVEYLRDGQGEVKYVVYNLDKKEHILKVENFDKRYPDARRG